MALSFGTGEARANCFPVPDDAAQPNTSLTSAIAKPSATKRAGVFLDASASMQGFSKADGIASGPATQNIFASLYAELPDILTSMRLDINYFRVGKTVDPINAAILNIAPRPWFYCPKNMTKAQRAEAKKDELDYYDTRCLDGKLPNDFQTESRIEKAIATIATPGTPADGFDVAVVITDLFLSSRELDASYNVDFRRSIGDILRSGRGVLIAAVEAPFKGPIYDLPSFGSNAGPIHNGTHPFFLLAFGDVGKLETLRARLTEITRPFGLGFETELFHDPSATLLAGSAAAASVASHTSIEPKGLPDRRIFDRFHTLRDDYTRLAGKPPFPALTLPRANRKYWSEVTATVVLPEDLRDPTVHGSVHTVDPKTYMFVGDEKTPCGKGWQSLDIQGEGMPLLVPLPPEAGPEASGSYRFALFGTSSEATKAFQTSNDLRNPSGLFMHTVRLRWEPEKSRELNERIVLPEWVNRFGFMPAAEAQVLKAGYLAVPLKLRKGTEARPLATGGMFPALNLAEIVIALQRITRDQMLDIPAIELGSFTVAWRFD